MHIDDTWYKPSVDKKIIKELSKRSNWAGIKHFSIYFTSLFIFGFLAVKYWGTFWCIPFFIIYGTIWAYSISNWHETLHRTAFKSRFLNDFFYQISAFMGHFESNRWRWSHTFHHTNTLQTQEAYDYEIQLTRPTDLIYLFVQFIPFGQLLYPHKTLQAEVIKHAFGNLTEVVKLNAPDDQKKMIIRNSRIYVIIWISIIIFSIYIGSWLPILLFVLPNYYGAPLNQIVNLTQHLGLPFDVKDHRLCTHNVKINPIFSFLYYRMEYHLEHHMFPMIPSHNLPELHNIIKAQLPKPYPSLYAFYKTVLPTVIKQAYDPNYYLKVNVPNE